MFPKTIDYFISFFRLLAKKTEVQAKNFRQGCNNCEDASFDILVRLYNRDGSREPRVRMESSNMNWMRALMTMEAQTAPMTKKFSYLCNQLQNGYFGYFR